MNREDSFFESLKLDGKWASLQNNTGILSACPINQNGNTLNGWRTTSASLGPLSHLSPQLHGFSRVDGSRFMPSKACWQMGLSLCHTGLPCVVGRIMRANMAFMGIQGDGSRLSTGPWNNLLPWSSHKPFWEFLFPCNLIVQSMPLPT